MRTTSICIPVLSLLAALTLPVHIGAQTRPRYVVTDLGRRTTRLARRPG